MDDILDQFTAMEQKLFNTVLLQAQISPIAHSMNMYELGKLINTFY